MVVNIQQVPRSSSPRLSLKRGAELHYSLITIFSSTDQCISDNTLADSRSVSRDFESDVISRLRLYFITDLLHACASAQHSIRQSSHSLNLSLSPPKNLHLNPTPSPNPRLNTKNEKGKAKIKIWLKKIFKKLSERNLNLQPLYSKPFVLPTAL